MLGPCTSTLGLCLLNKQSSLINVDKFLLAVELLSIFVAISRVRGL